MASRLADDTGTSLIELMIAVGMLCGAAVTLAALLMSSASLMAAARHRTCALVFARARLEELLAASRAGEPLADGADAVGADGVVTAVAAAAYLRRWRVVPPGGHADRLSLLDVEVEPRGAAPLHDAPVELIALVERP
jgi:Tfp pilus assembly protein PilV